MLQNFKLLNVKYTLSSLIFMSYENKTNKTFACNIVYKNIFLIFFLKLHSYEVYFHARSLILKKSKTKDYETRAMQPYIV